MITYNAELRDWTTYRTQGFIVVVGRVFGDKGKRWPDGRMIQTSALLTPRAAKEGNVVGTLNSHYLLVGAKRSLLEIVAEWERERSQNAAKPQPGKQAREQSKLQGWTTGW